MSPLRLLLDILVAAACVIAATKIRHPAASELRPWLLIGVVVLASLMLLRAQTWRGWRPRGWREWPTVAPFALAIAALAIAATVEGRFQFARLSVARAQPSEIERLGRHFIVGYRDPGFVRDLVERRAIAGIFLTRRNVSGRDAATIARDIRDLQDIRARQGLPPLWIATDQEGGNVSRLSPPLERQPSLAAMIRKAADAPSRQAAVTDYALKQAQGLASIGVNLNFAPVVDLDFGIRSPNDDLTRISERSISADAAIVSEVAGRYCETLASQGVHCTLKHFPGLGRVLDDTHRNEGLLNASLEELERADWIPFRALLGRTDSVLMVGHVRLPALDPSQPVSTSQRVISGLVRDAWRYNGVIVSDDLCMDAVFSAPGGIAQASLRALNAGADLLLVSWDGEQIYPVLASLLKAQAALDSDMLERSARRLQDAQSRLRLPAP